MDSVNCSPTPWGILLLLSNQILLQHGFNLAQELSSVLPEFLHSLHPLDDLLVCIYYFLTKLEEHQPRIDTWL